MSNRMNDNVNDSAILIVFGRPDNAKAPRAAWFRAENVEAAQRTALDMQLLTLAVDTDQARSIIADIPEGRFAVNG